MHRNWWLETCEIIEIILGEYEGACEVYWLICWKLWVELAEQISYGDSKSGKY